MVKEFATSVGCYIKKLDGESHNFRTLYQNVRGLGEKLRNLYINFVGYGFLVIAFTETWQPEVYSFEGFRPEYQVLRRERCGKSGKGVVVATRTTITANLISPYSRDNVEYLGVCVKTANPDVFVDCPYIPQ